MTKRGILQKHQKILPVWESSYDPNLSKRCNALPLCITAHDEVQKIMGKDGRVNQGYMSSYWLTNQITQDGACTVYIRFCDFYWSWKSIILKYDNIREGFKKNQLWKIPYRVLPPPPVMEKKFLFFFLKLDHFLRTFCKKCIFTIENPKKLRKFLKKW